MANFIIIIIFNLNTYITYMAYLRYFTQILYLQYFASEYFIYSTLLTILSNYNTLLTIPYVYYYITTTTSYCTFLLADKRLSFQNRYQVI